MEITNITSSFFSHNRISAQSLIGLFCSREKIILFWIIYFTITNNLKAVLGAFRLLGADILAKENEQKNWSICCKKSCPKQCNAFTATPSTDGFILVRL